MQAILIDVSPKGDNPISKIRIRLVCAIGLNEYEVLHDGFEFWITPQHFSLLGGQIVGIAQNGSDVHPHERGKSNEQRT